MRKLLSWDTLEIAEDEAKYELENWEEYKDRYDFEQKPDYETLLHALFEDQYLYSDAWDMMVEDLTELMGKHDYWHAKVKNFSWRSLDGGKYFRADNGKDFLSAILPETDCTFYIYKYRNGFAIQNYHHDSPTGNEWYYITPVMYETYQRYA